MNPKTKIYLNVDKLIAICNEYKVTKLLEPNKAVGNESRVLEILRYNTQSATDKTTYTFFNPACAYYHPSPHYGVYVSCKRASVAWLLLDSKDVEFEIIEHAEYEEGTEDSTGCRESS